jgi:hypothetical protein
MGLPGRFSLIVSMPFFLPVEPGVKVTRIWQAPPGGTSAAQLLVWSKSPVVCAEALRASWVSSLRIVMVRTPLVVCTC